MILYFQKIIIRRHLHLRWLKKTQNTFKSKDLIFTMFMHGAILFYTAGHYHTCLTYPPPPHLEPSNFTTMRILYRWICFMLLFFSFSLYSIQQQEVGAKESIILNNYTGVFFFNNRNSFHFYFFFFGH